MDTPQPRHRRRASLSYRPYSTIDMAEIYTRISLDSELHICLREYFDIRLITEATERYMLGCIDSAVVFPQIDLCGRCRTAKIMHYHRSNGRPDRERGVVWLHRHLGLHDFNLAQCLFGEHLLRDAVKDSVICLVEEEKTAVICSMVFPGCIWLATGGIHGLTAERAEVLRGRRVLLYPGPGAREMWRRRLGEIPFALNWGIVDRDCRRREVGCPV